MTSSNFNFDNAPSMGLPRSTFRPNMKSIGLIVFEISMKMCSLWSDFDAIQMDPDSNLALETGHGPRTDMGSIQ